MPCKTGSYGFLAKLPKTTPVLFTWEPPGIPGHFGINEINSIDRSQITTLSKNIAELTFRALALFYGIQFWM